MARWMRPEDEMPGECECGDRLCIIVAERESPKQRKTPRLVILIATEDGWDAVDELYQGYSPGDGVLWAWEKDVCGIAHAIFSDWTFSARRPTSPIIDREEARRMIDARDQTIFMQAKIIAELRDKQASPHAGA